MIISEKQIFELMNVARIITLQRSISFSMQKKVAELILDIEQQQSDKLIDIKNE